MDKTCKWKLTPGDMWKTGCKKYFCSIDYRNNPREEGMNFCCYCGGHLEQVDYKEDESDEPT